MVLHIRYKDSPSWGGKIYCVYRGTPELRILFHSPAPGSRVDLAERFPGYPALDFCHSLSSVQGGSVSQGSLDRGRKSITGA